MLFRSKSIGEKITGKKIEGKGYTQIIDDIAAKLDKPIVKKRTTKKETNEPIEEVVEEPQEETIEEASEQVVEEVNEAVENNKTL